MPTIISWTKETWNPVTGCSKVDGDCKNCYAATLSLRRGWTKLPWTAQNASANVVLHPNRLDKPRKFPTGTLVFVNSMSDLFHAEIPDQFILDVFQVMAECPHLIFQVLTKRPARMFDFCQRLVLGGFDLAGKRPVLALSNGPANHRVHVLPHVWLGTSIGSVKGLPRLDELRPTPATVRWLSIEPLTESLPDLDLRGIDWVAVGGESGPGFRPMEHAWARRVRDNCRAQNVAFFFKQSAGYRTETGTALEHADGSTWEWRQFPGDLRPPTRVGPPKR